MSCSHQPRELGVSEATVQLTGGRSRERRRRAHLLPHLLAPFVRIDSEPPTPDGVRVSRRRAYFPTSADALKREGSASLIMRRPVFTT